MLTGSTVSSLQGEPRSTHDIDVIVVVDESDIDPIIRRFPRPDFYLDRDSMQVAVREQGMFNLIDAKGGAKVDFWLLTGDSFEQARFGRRRKQRLLGLDGYVSSPEDTILAKLRWADASGGSEKHVTDALRVYEVQRDTLDLSYIQTWAERLHLRSLWEKLLRAADPSS